MQKRKKSRTRTSKRHKKHIVPLLPMEVPPERVIFMEELGRGAFGIVHKGVLRESPTIEVFLLPREQRVSANEGRAVAIKVLIERAGEEGKRQFLQEIDLMKEIGSHRNILSMLGYWVKSEPIMIIMEYVPHGDLLHWLRKKRSKLTGQKKNVIDVFKKSEPPVMEQRKGDSDKVKKDDDSTDDVVKTMKEMEEEKAGGELSKNNVFLGEKQGGNKTSQGDDVDGGKGTIDPLSGLDELKENNGPSTTVGENDEEKDKGNQTQREKLENSKEEINSDDMTISPPGSIPEPLGDTRVKITINQEEAGCGSKEDEDKVISGRDILCFAWQIAKGMDYLASRRFVHRDLAARNILVGEDRTVKIADFGLLRHTSEGEIYEVTNVKRLPMKWMAPEALEYGRFNHKTDVWSFGVVLWELSSMGGIPYPGISHTRLFNVLKTGYRMEKPSTCSDQIYELMLDCWKEDPNERPAFSQLLEILEKMMTLDTPYCDFDLLDGSQAYYSDAFTNTSESKTCDIWL